MTLWDYRYQKSAETFFDRWYGWAIRSRLEPVKKVARMMKERLPNILTYLHHRITNAMSEGINSKIQWIKYTARGFRNFDNFRTAIYFHCGGLDLSHTHQPKLRPVLSLIADAMRKSIVSPAQRSVAARSKGATKSTEDGYPVESFRELLDDLGTLAKNRVRIRGTDAEFYELTRPTPLQQRAFDLLGVAHL